VIGFFDNAAMAMTATEGFQSFNVVTPRMRVCISHSCLLCTTLAASATILVFIIAGFVAEYSAQPFNRDGWGGVPVDVTATIEKDKTTTCLQAEANASIVHSVAPFGSRHITQVRDAAVVVLRAVLP
jgi:ABC-type phosphate transport system permease subunit